MPDRYSMVTTFAVEYGVKMKKRLSQVQLGWHEFSCLLYFIYLFERFSRKKPRLSMSISD